MHHAHRCFPLLVLAFTLLIGTPHAQATTNTAPETPTPETQSSQRNTFRTHLPLIVASGDSAVTPAGGRTIVVTGSLQQAVRSVRPGDVLVLNRATYTEKVTIERSGTAKQPITLKGAGVGTSIIRGSIRLRGAAFWHIQDLDVNAAGTDDGVRIDAPSHGIRVQKVHLYGGDGYGVRVGNDVRDVRIEDSEIDHFDAGSSDAHGVGIMTASDVKVLRCTIHHNSGDAVQSNTPDYPGYRRWASNVVIADNDLHDNRENALDIKSTHGLTASNNRIWGVRAVSSSDGMAIQVQYDAQDIKLIGNQIWDAVEGIEVSRGTKNGTAYPLAPQRITIAGNLVRDLVASDAGDSGNGSGIVVRTSRDVQVYNNTVLRASGAALYLSESAEEDAPVNVDIRNNVFHGQANDLFLAMPLADLRGLTLDYNHYVRGRLDGELISVWRARGYEQHATQGEPQLDARFLPLPGSPLRDSGTDIGLLFTGAGPDRGWGELNP